MESPVLQTVYKISKHNPKYIKDIEQNVNTNIKLIKKTSSELLESKQLYYDAILKVYQEAFYKLINKTVTCSKLLYGIKNAYENALKIRNERLNQLILQDRIFGVTERKNEQQERIKIILNENEDLKNKNLKMSFDHAKIKTQLAKVQDEKFSDYLTLMKERDARYTLYFENLKLHLKMKELDGSGEPVDNVHGDPVVLRIALDKCREQLSIAQREIKRMSDEYAETVPRRNFDQLEVQYSDVVKNLQDLTADHQSLQDKFNKLLELQRASEQELERAGTPRPQWELCAQYMGGGGARWAALRRGLSSRDALRALLRQLGPAADAQPEGSPNEHFHGLGLDPAIPPYLRYEGKVRNLRLSRREIFVFINDIWIGKITNGQGMSMQDYVTKYFENRYQQQSVRAEWAYNLCSGAEQMLDDPQVKLFWGVLRGHLSEEIYTAHRQQWYSLRDNLYSKGLENITIEDFEKMSRSTFPLKSEVEIKSLSDTVRKQLKIKLNNNEINLDKLFQENEEGFDCIELARELFRQQRLAQDKYIREVAAELGGKNAANKVITVENLKRAFAIVDPAIDHIRMEKNVRSAFSALEGAPGLPLRVVLAALAAAHVPRVAARSQPSRGRGRVRRR